MPKPPTRLALRSRPSASQRVHPQTQRRECPRPTDRYLPTRGCLPATTELRRIHTYHVRGRGIPLQRGEGGRSLATAAAAAADPTSGNGRTSDSPADGPLKEYNDRVEEGRLRDDLYQRQIIHNLQTLYEALKRYTPPKVTRPSPDSLDTSSKRKSFFGSLFSRSSSSSTSGSVTTPENLPKGLYMYGDVGCGKTMLMDLFYDTLPGNIRADAKTRIHFHNFMQDVHRRMHVVKMQHGNDIDALPLVAADIAKQSSVLCFDEFQCTDVADAMILRRFLDLLMSHGVVLVTTSNRHPNELYKNGIQRESFIPCIELLKSALHVINLDSPTDYRKIPRPPSGVYHHPLDSSAAEHAQRWFAYLGDPNDPPHPATQTVWGREIRVPRASGKAAMFSFNELIGTATGAADYLELVRNYDAFIVTDVPGMTIHQKDLARRFITFVDAVYESRAKLVLTTAAPLQNLFLSPSELESSKSDSAAPGEVPDAMRHMMDDLGLSMSALKTSSLFSGDEERFAFARALSRLSEMGSREWVQRGMGVGLPEKEGSQEREAWMKMRSRWREDVG